LGTRDGVLNDHCYRLTGALWAVRASKSDGTVIETGDPERGMGVVSFCDTECGELPEPLPTGFFNRVVI
jgi:hypothetical protein